MENKINHVNITSNVLKVEELTRLVTEASAGAISVFLGTTRDNFEEKKVVRLEYEAYEPMAEQQLLKVCHDIRSKWDVHHIAIVHRIGVVPVSEASVIVAISSTHRRESLEAVQYAIDTLKATVPIWKKEVYDDGSKSWKENQECAWKS